VRVRGARLVPRRTRLGLLPNLRGRVLRIRSALSPETFLNSSAKLSRSGSNEALARPVPSIKIALLEANRRTLGPAALHGTFIRRTASVLGLAERSAARLAHQSGGLGVAGSNPAAPTIKT
jgi:hypothetical protein